MATKTHKVHGVEFELHSSRTLGVGLTLDYLNAKFPVLLDFDKPTPFAISTFALFCAYTKSVKGKSDDSETQALASWFKTHKAAIRSGNFDAAFEAYCEMPETIASLVYDIYDATRENVAPTKTEVFKGEAASKAETDPPIATTTTAAS
jgi:hypothetical protein